MPFSQSDSQPKPGSEKGSEDRVQGGAGGATPKRATPERAAQEGAAQEGPRWPDRLLRPKDQMGAWADRWMSILLVDGRGCR